MLLKVQSQATQTHSNNTAFSAGECTAHAHLLEFENNWCVAPSYKYDFSALKTGQKTVSADTAKNQQLPAKQEGVKWWQE